MTLTFIMLALLIAGALAWRAENYWQGSAKWIALISLMLLATVFTVFIASYGSNHHSDFSELQLLSRISWIAAFNIEYSIAIDQLSIVLIALTWLLAIICVLVSWHEIQQHAGFYYFNLLATIAGIIGVFVAVDMFLFFFSLNSVIFWSKNTVFGYKVAF